MPNKLKSYKRQCWNCEEFVQFNYEGMCLKGRVYENKNGDDSCKDWHLAKILYNGGCMVLNENGNRFYRSS